MHKLILFLKRRQISNRQNVFFFTFPVDKMKCKFQVSYCNFLNNKLTINFLGHELYMGKVPKTPKRKTFLF